MQVILNAGPLPERYKKVVTAIGVFDGVHRGHQRVIARAVASARRIRGTSVVVTFSPHPVAVLSPEKFNGYVISLEHRIRLIRSLGADVCYVLPFTRSFARRSAESFATNLLLGTLRAVKVVVGEDFYFGRQRQGTVALLQAKGIAVETVPLLKYKNINIKTQLLKKFISDGDLGMLRAFLGRDHGMLGVVGHGRRIGRHLGFPTANLDQENVITLPSGIYVARVFIGKKIVPCAFYIGTRPTFRDRPLQRVLEAHLLDFKGSLYGRTIGVEFLKKLRDDRAFPDDVSLSRAIARDVKRTRIYFTRHPAGTPSRSSF